MKSETIDALKWITGVLNSNEIPYRIGGGMAMYLYGSKRPVNDIDISVSGKDFDKIVPLVSEYITTGPKHYKNEKWDCRTLSLNYGGQEIDLTDVDTLLLRNKEDTEWLESKNIYAKHPDLVVEFENTRINTMNPRVLLEYKNELDGIHQLEDVEFLRKYINDNEI